LEIKEGVSVTSFDGSGYISKTLNRLIKTFEGASQEVRDGKVWKYLHHAVSDKEGTAYFWAGPKNKDANAGFEGGKLRGVQGSDTEEVQMITIDAYMQRTGLASVDILKIDAEGNDNKVIRGAHKAIDGGTALFTFEGGGGVAFTKEDIDNLDMRGFSCYSTSRAGLFRWSGGCMSETYMGSFRAKDKGNVFCTSRVRAPVMAAMFDALSFPMLIEQRVREGASPTGNRPQKDPFPLDNKSSERFTEVYVNIKPFCQPFPFCAATVDEEKKSTA
jgi:FkbM family methyltransferase